MMGDNLSALVGAGGYLLPMDGLNTTLRTLREHSDALSIHVVQVRERLEVLIESLDNATKDPEGPKKQGKQWEFLALICGIISKASEAVASMTISVGDLCSSVILALVAVFAKLASSYSTKKSRGTFLN